MDNNEIIKQAEATPQERAALLDSRINANARIAAEKLVETGAISRLCVTRNCT